MGSKTHPPSWTALPLSQYAAQMPMSCDTANGILTTPVSGMWSWAAVLVALMRQMSVLKGWPQHPETAVALCAEPRASAIG